MRRSLSIGLLLVLAAASGAADAAAQAFNWQGRLDRGQTLEIRGINGSIHAVQASGAEARVTAEKSANRSDPDEVEIEVVEHSGGITICAVYPSPRGEPNECRPGGGRMNTRDNDVKVEFEVQVPAGVVFVANTVNGGIGTERLSGTVRAHTVNGGIDIESDGLAEANTVNGSIDAVVGSVSDDLTFETVNGTITIAIPDDANLDVQASTVNGGISTDFPLTVQGRFGPKRISGTIGDGGPSLTLSTVNGAIEIRRR